MYDWTSTNFPLWSSDQINDEAAAFWNQLLGFTIWHWFSGFGIFRVGWVHPWCRCHAAVCPGTPGTFRVRNDSLLPEALQSGKRCGSHRSPHQPPSRVPRRQPRAGGSQALACRVLWVSGWVSPHPLANCCIIHLICHQSMSVFHSFLSVKTTQNKASLLKMPWYFATVMKICQQRV